MIVKVVRVVEALFRQFVTHVEEVVPLSPSWAKFISKTRKTIECDIKGTL